MKHKIKLLIITLIVVVSALALLAFWPEKEILQGEAEAKTINLSSKIPGRVLIISVNKGDVVKEGDVLVEIDTPELNAKQNQIQAKLDAASAMHDKAYNGSRSETVAAARSKMLEAKAGYEIAQKTNVRMQNLFKDGVVSAQKADESKARLDASYNLYLAAKSTYEMAVNGARAEDKNIATANVNQALAAVEEIDSYVRENKIVAPIDGEVSEISAEEGELIGTGYPIIVLNDYKNMWATFNVRENLLKDFKQGTEFLADIPALGLKDVPFTVTYVAVRGNYATYKATRARGEYDLKTFEVRAVPVEIPNGFKPGMSVIIRMD